MSKPSSKPRRLLFFTGPPVLAAGLLSSGVALAAPPEYPSAELQQDYQVFRTARLREGPDQFQLTRPGEVGDDLAAQLDEIADRAIAVAAAHHADLRVLQLRVWAGVDDRPARRRWGASLRGTGVAEPEAQQLSNIFTDFAAARLRSDIVIAELRRRLSARAAAEPALLGLDPTDPAREAKAQAIVAEVVPRATTFESVLPAPSIALRVQTVPRGRDFVVVLAVAAPPAASAPTSPPPPAPPPPPASSPPPAPPPPPRRPRHVGIEVAVGAVAPLTPVDDVYGVAPALRVGPALSGDRYNVSLGVVGFGAPHRGVVSRTMRGAVFGFAGVAVEPTYRFTTRPLAISGGALVTLGVLGRHVEAMGAEPAETQGTLLVSAAPVLRLDVTLSHLSPCLVVAPGVAAIGVDRGVRFHAAGAVWLGFVRELAGF